MPASVPGDLITDLEAAGMVGDPLYELNWLNASIWDTNTWTYSTTFTAPAGGGSTLLVFDGIKMGADIILDGKTIGNTTDQFLRYIFPVTLSSTQAPHTLEVVFDPKIDCGGRWMSCTGGWDWAPYTNTKQDGIPTFTKGIWKSVSLVQVGAAAITDMVPQITYAGEYPTAPLDDTTHGGFDVSVRVHTWAAKPTKGTMTVTGGWAVRLTQPLMHVSTPLPPCSFLPHAASSLA